MTKLVTLFTLAAIAAAPLPALGDEVKAGDRVAATAAFFMCGAREDLATMDALERQGDRQTALKIGMQRCESGRASSTYVVEQGDADALCIRSGSTPYCLWARRSALQVTPSQ